MKTPTYSSLLAQAAPVVRQAGDFIRREFLGFDRRHVETKSRNSLVSYVDKQAEAMLVDGLRPLLPEAGFLAEEGTGKQAPEGLNWIIDPLDGTTNFIHGVPVFAVSVALCQGNTPLIGLVLDVMPNQLYTAVRGEGAYREGQKIQASSAAKLENTLLATGFPYAHFDFQDKYMALLAALMRKTRGLRRLGAAAIDLAYTANGVFDSFFEVQLSPWDVAAGALLVQEAGGKVSDFSGGNDFIFGGEILATGAGLHTEMLEDVQAYFKQ